MRLLSTEHFSVDGTLILAWASMKSFKPVDGRNVETNFHGEARSNVTHASTTDPDAKLYRKGLGMEAKLAFLGHALMENRSGLVAAACVTQANSHAERVAALAMIEARADHPIAVTLGADKGYDAADFVNEPRTMKVCPHVAQNKTRRHGRSALDARTTRHSDYAASQRIRKRIEEAFGWMKTVGGMTRLMLRGTYRVGWAFTLAAATYSLIRLQN
jgi:IS5 family transposase